MCNFFHSIFQSISQWYKVTVKRNLRAHTFLDYDFSTTGNSNWRKCLEWIGIKSYYKDFYTEKIFEYSEFSNFD